MRAIRKEEQKQRGCIYCANVRTAAKDKVGKRPEDAEKSERIFECPFDVCPFHELDDIECYIRDWDKVMERRFGRIMLGGRFG